MKSRRALKLAPSMLAVSLCLLSACGQSGGTVSVDGSADAQRGRKVKPTDPGTGTPTPTPAPAPAPASGYDTSIGSGVDASGFAILPLRSGAHRFFVSSASGNDANGCAAAQNAATPLKSIAAGVACVTNGNGDQVMVAQGSTFAAPLPSLNGISGFSAQYPTVLQSYDPADPTNESKFGHAGSGQRPVITAVSGDNITGSALVPTDYLVVRGFDINPGNAGDKTLGFVGSAGQSNDYILIENNILRYTQLAFTQDPTVKANHIVVRMNAIYGSWSPTAHAQGVYGGGIASLTIEDNVFWHNGWKIGASRDADPSIGGATIFRHSVYSQTDTSATVRRNIFFDPSATGCSCRGDATISENVFIDNPIAINAGAGNDYNVYNPNGVMLTIDHNAILGDADINTPNPRGMAIVNGNGKQGSSAHHNLIVRSRDPNGVLTYAFNTQANFNQPSYMLFDSNLIYKFSNATVITSGAYLGQDLATYTNNKWDAPASGSNVNLSSMTLPNPMTSDALYVALGCTNKQTCVNQMVETPELGWGAKVRALLWQGYGL